MGGPLTVTDEVKTYLATTGIRLHPVLKKCDRAAARAGKSNRQIDPDQGALMALIAQSIGAKRYLEIGTYLGYSALAVGLVLPKTGKAICLDIDPAAMTTARGFWKEAGLSRVIEGRVGNAHEMLPAMIKAKEKPFDLVFIDADKEGYDNYYEHALQLTRKGGLIMLDNMLRNGTVAYPDQRDAYANAVHKLNRKIQRDPRVDMALVPVGDGLMIARKR